VFLPNFEAASVLTRGAAAWMIEKVPGYPAMFRECARAEIDKMTHMIDEVIAGLEEPRNT